MSPLLILCLLFLLPLLLWVAGMCCAYALGRIGRQWHQMGSVAQAHQELPSLSVVIAAHNEAANLRRHLPAILEQEYDVFEVIVVDMCSTDDTKNVLERLEMQYANLRHTFTPLSARDISVERLALTLGIRTASYDWIVITQPHCRPLSEEWLTRIGATIVHPERSPQSPRLTEPQLLVGLTRLEQQRTSWTMRKVELFRLWNDIFHCNHVLAGHAAMRADGCNFAIHKDFFLQEGGFTTGRNLKSGAVELLANQCSTCDNTALMLSPGTLVIEERSWDARQWKQERIFDVETRHHRQHAFSYHLKAALQQAMPVLVVFSLLLFWLSCGVLFLSDVLVDSETGLFDSSDFTAMLSPTLWLAAVLSVLMLIVYFTALVRNFKRSAHQLGYDRLNTFLLLVFLFSLPFWSLSATWAHRRTSKNDFRKKFV